MAQSNDVVKISQLPEKTQISKTDYLLVEDTEDSRKIKVGVLTDYLDQQVNSIQDSIQSKMDQATETIEIINEGEQDRALKFSEIQKKEEVYADNEAKRQENETIRESVHEQWTTKINDLDDKETERDTTFSGWEATMSGYADAETARVTAEKARENTESNRATNFEKMQSTVSSVEQSEASRNEGYSEMVNYFNTVKETIKARSNVGLSKPTTDSNKIIKVATIELSKDEDGSYGELVTNPCTCLLHITERLDGVDKLSGFIFCAFKVIDAAPDTKVYASSLNTINESNVKVTYNTSESGINIYVEYKAINTGAVVECHRLSDNSIMFEEGVVLSTIEKDSEPATTTSGSNNISFNDITDIQKNLLPANMELQLLGLMEQFKVIRTEMGNISNSVNVAPYTMYPVGSVYETTLSTNPSTILGGGTWELIYAANETITDEKNNEVYNYTSYKWNRTE